MLEVYVSSDIIAIPAVFQAVTAKTRHSDRSPGGGGEGCGWRREQARQLGANSQQQLWRERLEFQQAVFGRTAKDEF